jgi:hypothetical protein
MFCSGEPWRRDRGHNSRPGIFEICVLLILLAVPASLAAQSAGDPAGSAGPPPAAPQTAADLSPAKAESLSGTLIDPDGAVISGATVTLTQGGTSQTCISAGDGLFQFTKVSAGTYELRVEAPGFAPLKQSGSLVAGESLTLPQLRLAVGATIQITSAETLEQIATEQIREEERQRLLGIVPNFYVTYEKSPVPLTPRQKFQLAWKSSIDPVQFGINAASAGFQQSIDSFNGYGQGAKGYLKRFSADTANVWVGNFIGGAILPSLLRQDPRYFYKGTGSKTSRFLYALSSVFVCKGDNGRWQPNYSNVFGSLSAGAISNLYYPASNRQGVALTFENTATGLAGSAFSAVLQEFFLKRFTPHNPDTDPPRN